jgi:hypothetical protein
VLSRTLITPECCHSSELDPTVRHNRTSAEAFGGEPILEKFMRLPVRRPPFRAMSKENELGSELASLRKDPKFFAKLNELLRAKKK